MNNTTSDSQEFSDYTQRAILATVIFIIAIVGILGNTVVFLAVVLSKQLRTPNTALLLNLAVADLLVALALPWNSVALLGTDGLPVGEWICVAVAAVVFISIACSIFTIAVIALSRLLLLTQTHDAYRRIYSLTKIFFLWLPPTWIIPFFVFTLPPAFSVGAVGYSAQLHLCGSKTENANFKTYNTIRSMTIYPISLLTLLVSYVLIGYKLYRHSRTSLRVSSENGIQMDTKPDNADPTAESNPQPATPILDNSSPSRTMHKENKITKCMVYVVCGFACCLVPYTAALYLDTTRVIIPYTTTILFAKCAVNPFIYAFKLPDYKIVMRCIITRKWDRIPQPSDFLEKMLQ